MAANVDLEKILDVVIKIKCCILFLDSFEDFYCFLIDEF